MQWLLGSWYSSSEGLPVSAPQATRGFALEPRKDVDSSLRPSLLAHWEFV